MRATSAFAVTYSTTRAPVTLNISEPLRRGGKLAICKYTSQNWIVVYKSTEWLQQNRKTLFLALSADGEENVCRMNMQLTFGFHGYCLLLSKANYKQYGIMHII